MPMVPVRASTHVIVPSAAPATMIQGSCTVVAVVIAVVVAVVIAVVVAVVVAVAVAVFGITERDNTLTSDTLNTHLFKHSNAFSHN